MKSHTTLLVVITIIAFKQSKNHYDVYYRTVAIRIVYAGYGYG